MHKYHKKKSEWLLPLICFVPLVNFVVNEILKHE